jgi:23S rRNA pseudouridine1911/1915/1917 synthase
MSTWKSEQEGRLDSYLAQVVPSFSRSKLQKFIEEGKAKVNGSVVAVSKFSIKPGDEITFDTPAADPLFPLPEKGEVPIIFEDDVLIVVNKPVGMVVHPNSFQEHGTLVQALLTTHPEIAHALYDAENPVSRLRPGIVHRLDKETSGVMVVAKTSEALQILAQQFHNHTTKKIYETILYGALKEEQTVDAPIRRKGGGNKNRMGASHNPEEGRAARTHFTPVKIWSPYASWPQEEVTHARCSIETGRTHQIRVHAKFIGHPVLGDELYGNKPSRRLSEKLGITHQVLHAASLTFVHPHTGKEMTFEAPLPALFSTF